MKRLNLQTQKKKHLRSVTLICVGISKNRIEEFKNRACRLKASASVAAQKEMKLPKSDEDIEQLADYPDVAAIVETIAMKKASEQSSCT